MVLGLIWFSKAKRMSKDGLFHKSFSDKLFMDKFLSFVEV